MVKNPPATQETQIQSLGWEDPLEKGMATHSSILAWRIPWAEEPGRLQSMGVSKELDMNEVIEHSCMHASQLESSLTLEFLVSKETTLPSGYIQSVGSQESDTMKQKQQGASRLSGQYAHGDVSVVREAAIPLTDLTHLPLEAAKLGTSLLDSGHHSVPSSLMGDRYSPHSWQRQTHLK